MPYNQLISTQNPGYLLILIDQSGSMSSSFGGSAGGSKSEECAKAVNRVLREIGLACSDGESIKNRVNVSVIAYGSGGNARNAFSGTLASSDIISVQELIQNVLRIEKIKQKVPDGAGGLVDIETDFPVWIEAVAGGGTPMTAAFEKAYQLASQWITNHQASFPPIVINITDGAPDNQSTAKSSSQKLTQLKTNDGHVLILNAHISGSSHSSVEFPASPSELPSGDSKAQFLFDISSELPPIMLEFTSAQGYQVKPGMRGFVYNAKAEAMIKLLNIGSGSMSQFKES
jgi:hypothetical protein